jgi:hypothetical protein
VQKELADVRRELAAPFVFAEGRKKSKKSVKIAEKLLEFRIRYVIII